MPEFRQDEWAQAQEEVSFEVEPRHMVDITVSCTKNVQVLGVSEASGQAAVVLKSGPEFRFRGPVYGFKKIVIKGTGSTPFGLRVVHGPRQNGEPISPEKPPVIELPEASNLVLRMRQIAAAHHKMNRTPVLEPDEFPSFGRYEYDEDDEVLFEEEQYAKRVKEAKEAKARKDAEAPEATKAENGSAVPDPSEPEAKPPGEPQERLENATHEPEASTPPPES